MKKLQKDTTVRLNSDENTMEVISNEEDLDDPVKSFDARCREVEILKENYPKHIFNVIVCLDLYYLNIQMIYYTIFFAASDFSQICQRKETIPPEEAQKYNKDIHYLHETMEIMRKDISKLIEGLKSKLAAEEMETLEYLQRLLNRPVLDSFKKTI